MRIEHRAGLVRIAEDLKEMTGGKIAPKIPFPNYETRQQNCWGFTAQAAGWIEYEAWLGHLRMEELLQKNTMVVKPHEVMTGDIAVYRLTAESIHAECYPVGTLWHTALVVKPHELVLHKPGSLPVMVEPLDGRYDEDGLSISYRRVIKGGEKADGAITS